MSVNSVNYSNNVQTTYDSAAKVSEKSEKEASPASPKDSYESGKITYFDRAGAEKAINAAESAKAQSIQKLFSEMLKTQYGRYVQAMPDKNIGSYFANLEVDDATRLQAQQDISEDGYWGVKQTAGRILDFAKAIAGDDPDKLEEMKKAVEKGFALARDMWGGELPSISGQTYDAVMQGFDDWSKSISEKQQTVAAAIE